MPTKNYIAWIIAAVVLTVASAFGAEVASFTITKNGSVWSDQGVVGLKEVAAIAAAAAKKDKDASFTVITDEEVSAKALGEFMDTCRKAGVTHFTLMSQERSKK